MDIIALHEIDESHLETITAQMTSLGAPTIRAIVTASGLVALEGAHRLAAADKLGMTPNIITINLDTDAIPSDLDIDEGREWDSWEGLIDYIDCPTGVYYTFGD